MNQGTGTATPARVVVVDDEPMLADLLTEWVMEKWRCDTFTDGPAAVEAIDESVDVVLLDRNMPELSGDEVLRTIRGEDYKGQVMMVSAIEPDYDVIDLAVDDYLTKPVDRPTLQARIEQLILRRSYLPNVQSFLRYAAKINLLESTKAPSELADDERYLSLKTEADRLRQEADATLGERTPHLDALIDISADD